MSSVLSPDSNNSKENLVEPRKSRGGSLAKMLINFLLLALIIAGVVYGIKTKPELLGLSKTSGDAQKENQELIAKIGKIIKLPDGEVPTIATVTDLSKTQDREFFKNAKEGDKVLVYPGAKRAFLYRPSENKIIEVGVVSVDNQPEKQVAGEKTEIPVITPTPLPTPTLTVTPQPTLKPTVQQLQPTNSVTPAPTQTTP